MSTLLAVPPVERPYWEGLSRSQFTQPRCAACGTWYWPARFRCAECGSFDQEWTLVAPEGTVYSWTRCWYPFVPARTDQLPYVVVLAELPEAGDARVLGVLDGAEDGLRIGAPVRGRIGAPSERSGGLATVMWRLQP
jgi:uncharacterized OB-fold protein